MKKVYRVIIGALIASVAILQGCANTVHKRTGKQIILMEEVSQPLIVSKYGPGVYEQSGEKDGYELYIPVAADVTNYVGSGNRYIAVKNIGPNSEVCIPDSLNLFWCTKAPTKLIK